MFIDGNDARVEITEIDFSVLTHDVSEADADVVLYNKCFKLWKKIWNETFEELGDDKTGQWQMIFILLNELCVLHVGETSLLG